MKKIYSFLLLLTAMAMTTTVNAQVINGDLNHNQGLDVEDVTLLIDGYLSGTTEQIQTGGTPFGVDNSFVAGTWYKSTTESVTFNADGTTDYAAGYTYEFLAMQGYILFYNASGVPVYALRVLKATSDYLVLLPTGSSTPVRYTAAQSVSITLSQTSLELKPDEFARLTATVVPSDAGIVNWSSSDESVATVVSGLVTAVADGTAIITASVAGNTVTCTVTVDSKTCNNGYEYVDLGLSVKWATMNVGANAPEEYGDYFTWGETTAKSIYDWSTYTLCKGNDSSSTMTKYCTDSICGTFDNKTVLELEDDAAYVNWGGSWRMPTNDELNELKIKCTKKWTTQNGVNGCKVTGPNGNSIFLPAAGYRVGTSLTNAGSYGYYWSSSLNSSSPRDALSVYFKSSTMVWYYSPRYYGRSVRAVCP